MTGSDIAIIVATFLGPIFAVAVTLWHQGRTADYQMRMNIFGVLMRLRRHGTNNDFVGAYNLVPVHFHKERKIIAAYREVQRVVNDPAWEIPDAVPRLNQQHEVAISQLLFEMSKCLKVNVEAIDIQNGAYAPRGWKTDAERTEAMQSAFFRVLTGTSAVSVYVQTPVSEPTFKVGAESPNIKE